MPKTKLPKKKKGKKRKSTIIEAIEAAIKNVTGAPARAQKKLDARRDRVKSINKDFLRKTLLQGLSERGKKTLRKK